MYPTQYKITKKVWVGGTEDGHLLPIGTIISPYCSFYNDMCDMGIDKSHLQPMYNERECFYSDAEGSLPSRSCY